MDLRDKEDDNITFDDVQVSNAGICKNPDCRSRALVVSIEDGDIVCSECGWVKHDRVEDPGLDLRDIGVHDGVAARVTLDTSRIQGLLDGASGGVMIEKNTNTSMANITRISESTAISKHDKMVQEVNKRVMALSSRLPGEVYEDDQVLCVELFMLIWEATQGKFTPKLERIAACLWAICIKKNLPFLEMDFHRALSEDSAKPIQAFRRAKKSINENIHAHSKVRELYLKLDDGRRITTNLELALMRRMCEQLHLQYAIATLAAYIYEGLSRREISANKPRELKLSAALHLACHRKNATAREEQTTASRISSVTGQPSDKIDSYCQSMHGIKDRLIDEAITKLQPEVKTALGIPTDKK
eukprot:TRINITY_DN14506_c0_g1_i1.p1 TRINITY_DN14506_c0_g1~~TRINITY_DN14506_c0_g1_i1.p1  ORF type:complete len:358 (+),score=70.14 TRINITY_DN14506_c0_g1_i1:44-1117(+)